MVRFDLYVPEDLNDLLRFLHKNGNEAIPIANGTDLINRIRRKQVRPKLLADLSGLSELKYVKAENGLIKIGAMTTIDELMESKLIRDHYEVFSQVAERFGAPNITGVATVGGNVCAAASSEDLIPVFLVLDANIKVLSLDGERTIRIEDFVKEKRITDLRPGEILTEISFQAFNSSSSCAFQKIGMRNSLIIAFVSTAVFLDMDTATGRVNEVRVALNRVKGKIPARARETEQVLRGKTLDDTLLSEAAATLHGELQLTSDFRVTGDYRLEVAKVLFRRALDHCVQRILRK